MGCVLEFIVSVVFEGFFTLLFEVAVRTWPGLLLGMATGALVLWQCGGNYWRVALAAFLVLWAIVGCLYWGRRSKPLY